MKYKKFNLTILGILLISLGIASNNLSEILLTNENVYNNNETNLKSAGFWEESDIYIDDDSILYTWALTKIANAWCSGSGTWNDPYIIENVTVNGGFTDNCITIMDSNVYFIIRNVTVYNSESLYAGIYLNNVNNSWIYNSSAYNNDIGIYLENSYNNTISGNNCSNNNGDGIRLSSSSNNTIFDNDCSNNTYDHGISLYGSSDNTIFDNDCSNNTYHYGIFLSGSSDNNISNNTCSYNGVGIRLDGSSNYTISGNNCSNNDYGIRLSSSSDNTISGNNCSNNDYNGIHLYDSSDNIISNNTCSYNYYNGIYLYDSSDNNILYLNIFIANNENAADDGVDNQWDNGSIGNYWSDYIGVDTNDDEIGDTPYTIQGSAGSQDNYPIWWDRPVISINSPNTNDIFDNSPDFDISIDEGIVNTTWYTLDEELSNITFTGLTGNIDQTEWIKRVDGPVIIKFFTNDSRGYIGFTEITVLKESIPQITINTPTLNETFGFNAPEFNITVNDLSPINTTWYTIDGGLTNYTFSELNDFINQTAWDQMEDGIITIRFYANDSLGNLGFKVLNVIKDTALPVITIISPNDSELFGTTAPSFNVEIYDANLDTMWYTLDNGLTNTTFTTNGTISQTLWDTVSNGTATWTFYANDSAGNIGFAEVTIRKDAYAPIITINNPQDSDVIGTTAPNFDISIHEPDLDKTWYSLNGGTTIFFTELTGTINQTLWDALSDGNITIRFYAKDSAGNIGFTEVTIRKDVNAPIIAINNPQNSDVIGAIAPNFNISIDELNLDKTWYSLNGGNNITFTGLTGIINQALWDALPEGNVIIRFYANDTLGRIGFQEVTVVKTISQQSPPEIPGYNIILLLGIVSTIAAIIVKKRLNHLN